MFVSSESGGDVLFIYRRGENLQRAGTRFLFGTSDIDKEFARLLLEATDFAGARCLPVGCRSPAVND